MELAESFENRLLGQVNQFSSISSSNRLSRRRNSASFDLGHMPLQVYEEEDELLQTHVVKNLKLEV